MAHSTGCTDHTLWLLEKIILYDNACNYGIYAVLHESLCNTAWQGTSAAVTACSHLQPAALRAFT